MSPFPYADRVPVHRALPEHGTPRAEVLATLRSMAEEEDRTWESGGARAPCTAATTTTTPS